MAERASAELLRDVPHADDVSSALLKCAHAVLMQYPDLPPTALEAPWLAVTLRTPGRGGGGRAVMADEWAPGQGSGVQPSHGTWPLTVDQPVEIAWSRSLCVQSSATTVAASDVIVVAERRSRLVRLEAAFPVVG